MRMLGNMITPEQLVESVAGRNLCMAYVQEFGKDDETSAADEFRRFLSGVSLIEGASDQGRASFGWDESGKPLSGNELVMAVESSLVDQGVNFANLPGAVARKLDEFDLDAMPTGAAGRDLLRAALTRAVDELHLWGQPLDAEERIAASAPVRAALVRVAAHILASKGAAGWDRPHDSARQMVVYFPGRNETPAPKRKWWQKKSETPAQELRARPCDAAAITQILADDAAENAEAEARDSEFRRTHPDREYSGNWWSVPPFALTRSTRPTDLGTPSFLHYEEDSFGDEQALSWCVKPHNLNIYEVAAAGDWADLCAKYPRTMTSQTWYMWAENTGRTGEWVIPAWELMARDYDGIHLTTSAYLEMTGAAVPVPHLGNAGQWASTLAGWSPDITYYFAPISVDEDSRQEWHRDEDGQWQPGAGR
ncbi:hypothetical protein [Timonella senegalensis]